MTAARDEPLPSTPAGLGPAPVGGPGTLSDGRTDAFGEYRVVRTLGQGGMGCVVEADDPKLGRRVAIKVMRPELAARPLARERFLREARAAAAVRHEHVVPVYHVGEQDGAPFLVMPLLPGESLADRLERAGGPLPPAEVARVGREAALGLAAAHAAGLVHRDVKPGNLFLEAPGGRVVVLDFGLARAADGADGLSLPGSVSGTPGYLAPEQANGLAVDARADLFGLGAVLYHAATGTRPFHGDTLTAVLRAVAEHHPPAPRAVNPAVPEPLSNLILRLLSKKPDDRPESAVAVAQELAGDVPLVSRIGPSKRTAARRGWAIAGLVAAGAAGLLWLFVGPRGREGPAPPQPVPAPPAEPAVRYRGSVDLLVYRKDDTGADVLVPLSDPRAMPLGPDDQVKLLVTVDPPAWVYVFWIDDTGAAVPAYPWRFNEWGTRPAAEKPADKLDIKWPEGQALKITGDAAGVETVLMLARPTKLERTDAEVQSWFAGLKPVPFQGDKARAWFEDFDLVRHDAARRAVGMADSEAAGGPRGLQALLRQRIGPAAGTSRAVSFSRLGKKEDR